jgi:hypothetical protein
MPESSQKRLTLELKGNGMKLSNAKELSSDQPLMKLAAVDKPETQRRNRQSRFIKLFKALIFSSDLDFAAYTRLEGKRSPQQMRRDGLK